MSSLLSSLLFATLRQLRSVALLMGFTLFTLGWSVSVHTEPFAYIANAFSNTVSVLDTATNVIVATVPVGIAPRGVAVTPTGDFVYITNANSETVSVIATNTNTVVATIRVGATPWGVAVTPEGAFVYVTNALSHTTAVIATATNTVVATIPTERWAASLGQFIGPVVCGNSTIGSPEQCDRRQYPQWRRLLLHLHRGAGVQL